MNSLSTSLDLVEASSNAGSRNPGEVLEQPVIGLNKTPSSEAAARDGGCLDCCVSPEADSWRMSQELGQMWRAPVRMARSMDVKSWYWLSCCTSIDLGFPMNTTGLWGRARGA